MIQKAKMHDAKAIQRLVNTYAEQGKLLPRSLSDIYDYLRDFFIYKERNHDVAGVCALHLCWEDLAEIRSLAVAPTKSNKRIGEQLVGACLQEAKQLGIQQVFLLTYIPSYFERFGFRIVDKSALPQKIWRDCINCIKFPDCDETAMIQSL